MGEKATACPVAQTCERSISAKHIHKSRLQMTHRAGATNSIRDRIVVAKVERQLVCKACIEKEID